MAYITVQDIRDEGVSVKGFSDEWIAERIALAQDLVEQLTGCYYEKRDDQVFVFDGKGIHHEVIPLPIPPVNTDAVSSVTVSGEGLDPTCYEVVMPSFPDGRKYPRLRRIDGYWPEGKSNILVTGDFGYVDVIQLEGGGAEYHTPARVKHLMKRLVMFELPPIGDEEGQKSKRVIEESHRNYSYRIEESKGRGFFGDPDIDRMFIALRRIHVATV